MKTIKQCSDLLFSGSEFTFKETYEAPESEIIQIRMDSSILQTSGSGSGHDWGDEGDD